MESYYGKLSDIKLEEVWYTNYGLPETADADPLQELHHYEASK